MNRPGLLSVLVISTTALVLLAITIVRYSPWFSSANANHLQGQGSAAVPMRTTWDDLPQVQPFELTERSGRLFKTEELKEKVWVVSFFYSACPSVCKNQNAKIKELSEQISDKDVTFVSITCDPENDTPDHLKAYANGFRADPQRWLFLTGEMDKIKQIGQEQFGVAVEKGTHGTKLMLIGRWGRLRGYFDWDDDVDLNRFQRSVDELLQESEPPLGKRIRHRSQRTGDFFTNPHEVERESHPVPEGSQSATDPDDQASWQETPWIKQFSLTERSGDTFHSKQMKNRVWVASFFFASCPTHCKQQSMSIKQLLHTLGDRDVTFVSITTDPKQDTPAKLRQYARSLDADPAKWLFLTGELKYIRRIGSEYFGVHADERVHANALLLIDRWGKIRGKFRWSEPDEMIALRTEIDSALRETSPPEGDRGTRLETTDHPDSQEESSKPPAHRLGMESREGV